MYGLFSSQTESKIPVSVRNKNEAEDLPNSGESTLVTYLQTQVTADVHRSVFDLFPALREQGNSARYVSKLVYTSNVKTFPCRFEI